MSSSQRKGGRGGKGAGAHSHGSLNDTEAPIEHSVAALSVGSVGSDTHSQVHQLADLDGHKHDIELYEEALKRSKMDVGEAYESYFVNEAQTESLKESCWKDASKKNKKPEAPEKSNIKKNPKDIPTHTAVPATTGFKGTDKGGGRGGSKSSEKGAGRGGAKAPLAPRPSPSPSAPIPAAPSPDSKPLLRPPPSAAVPTATASATKAPVAASAPSTNAWSMGNLAKDMAKTQQEEAERMHAQAQRTQQMALAAQQQFASTSPLQPSAQATAAAGRGQSTGGRGQGRGRGRGRGDKDGTRRGDSAGDAANGATFPDLTKPPSSISTEELFQNAHLQQQLQHQQQQHPPAAQPKSQHVVALNVGVATQQIVQQQAPHVTPQQHAQPMGAARFQGAPHTGQDLRAVNLPPNLSEMSAPSMSFGDFGAGGDVAPSKSYGSLASGREALGSVQRMGGAHATHVEHGADGSDGSQHMGYNEYGGGDQMGELGDGGEADHSAHMYSAQMGQYGYAAYGNYVMPGYNAPPFQASPDGQVGHGLYGAGGYSSQQYVPSKAGNAANPAANGGFGRGDRKFNAGESKEANNGTAQQPGQAGAPALSAYQAPGVPLSVANHQMYAGYPAYGYGAQPGYGVNPAYYQMSPMGFQGYTPQYPAQARGGYPAKGSQPYAYSAAGYDGNEFAGSYSPAMYGYGQQIPAGHIPPMQQPQPAAEPAKQPAASAASATSTAPNTSYARGGLAAGTPQYGGAPSGASINAQPQSGFTGSMPRYGGAQQQFNGQQQQGWSQ